MLCIAISEANLLTNSVLIKSVILLPLSQTLFSVNLISELATKSIKLLMDPDLIFFSLDEPK